MDEKDFTMNTPGNNVGVADYGDTSRKTISKNMNEAKEKISGQATELKHKLAEQSKTYGNQLAQKIDNARGKTSARLHTASERIHSLAMYVESHNARDMSAAVRRNSQELVKKHPGKSILIGMFVGVLLGRLLTGMRRRRY